MTPGDKEKGRLLCLFSWFVCQSRIGIPALLLHVAEEILAGYRGQVVHRNVSVKKSLHFGYLILKLFLNRGFVIL